MEDYKCIKKDTLFKKTLHITLHYITKWHSHEHSW